MQVRHEEAAAFMACGYAKFTGKLGVCLATSGPGGIHLLNGLYDAKLDSQPVLAITGLQFHDLIAPIRSKMSIAGTMPTPLEAVYGATKAFGLSLVQSLRNELKDTGMTVTALQPGPTNTNFFHRAGLDDTEVGSESKFQNDPAYVARQGYEALMAGEDHVFSSSMKTKVQGELGKFIPESVKAEQHRKISEPKSK